MSDPGSLRLLEAQAPAEGGSGGKPQLRQWKAIAYTGAPVQQWFGMCIVDLAGMRPLNLEKNPIPLLLNHGWAFGDESPRMGAINAMNLTKGSGGVLELSGVFLSNDKVDGVVRDLDQGFPFQFSIGPEPHRIEQLAAGSRAVVNGREITGPCEIVREWSLREGSVVALGADKDTSTVALSAARRAISQKNTRSLAMADDDKTTATGAQTDATTPEDTDKEGDADTSTTAPVKETALSSPGSSPGGPQANASLALASSPASIEELEALKGGDAFTLACIKGKLSLGQAKAMLGFSQQQAAAKAAGDGTTDPIALGAKPGAPGGAGGAGGAGALKFAGATGTDPGADWDNSEPLRKHLESRGIGRKTFCAVVESMQRGGRMNHLEYVNEL